MKYILIISLILVACATEPKVPAACQKNLNYCVSAYDPAQGLTHKQWNDLCQKDLDLCRSEWGQR